MADLRRRMRFAAMLVSAAMVGAACGRDLPPARPAGTSVQASRPVVDASRTPAVDTIRARLTVETRAEIQSRAGAAAQAVVLFIREQDVFTCEDLGRQSRELRAWAVEAGLPFLVWAEVGPDTRIPVFLRREHISGGAVFLTRSPLRMEETGTVGSPAAMVVRLPTGEAHGFAHPERVANVRPRSFAQELRDIYRS